MNHFLVRTLLALVVAAALGRSAMAGDTYTIRENVQVADKSVYAYVYDFKTKATVTTSGVPQITDKEIGHSWKVSFTVLEVKDGSPVRMLVEVDSDSFDKAKNNGKEIIMPCPFAGQKIVLTRHPDESLTNDFRGDATHEDIRMLNNFVTPDEADYPDKPVAVGDTWDQSAKVANYIELGPDDQVTSQGRLDWVKTINGKQTAQITSHATATYHKKGNVEMDVKDTNTELVDLASGISVQSDEKTLNTYTTPMSEPTRVTGSMEMISHSERLPNLPAGPTTKP